MDRSIAARSIQRDRYIESFARCVKSFGRDACNRADAANRASGKFMCQYNRRTDATVLRDVSDANYADSNCKTDIMPLTIYDGFYFQDLKYWCVPRGYFQFALLFSSATFLQDFSWLLVYRIFSDLFARTIFYSARGCRVVTMMQLSKILHTSTSSHRQNILGIQAVTRARSSQKKRGMDQSHVNVVAYQKPVIAVAYNANQALKHTSC